MAYIIKGAAICAGVLLLLAAYSTGNPIPRDPRSDDFGCRHWLQDTSTETEAIAHMFNGIRVFLNLTSTKLPEQDFVSTYLCIKHFTCPCLFLYNNIIMHTIVITVTTYYFHREEYQLQL